LENAERVVMLTAASAIAHVECIGAIQYCPNLLCKTVKQWKRDNTAELQPSLKVAPTTLGTFSLI